MNFRARIETYTALFNMQKLTIRAALEALTYADDKELINELEIRARKKTYKKTYVCYFTDYQNTMISGNYVFYAPNEDRVIDKIVKCDNFIKDICSWAYDENALDIDEDYIEDWPESAISKCKRGDDSAFWEMRSCVTEAINNGLLVIETVEDLYDGPES